MTCPLIVIALKIHITAEMNDELAGIGGFKTEHRGLIDVKVSSQRQRNIPEHATKPSNVHTI